MGQSGEPLFPSLSHIPDTSSIRGTQIFLETKVQQALTLYLLAKSLRVLPAYRALRRLQTTVQSGPPHSLGTLGTEVGQRGAL